MNRNVPVNTYRDNDYRSKNGNNSNNNQTRSFENARTVYLWQVVEDVEIGTGRDYNTGQVYSMTIPIAVDQYYSSEFGGVHDRYSWKEWEDSRKELILRGWYYNGRTYSRTNKDGKDLDAYINECLKTIESAVNYWFDPNQSKSESTTKKVTPLWAYMTLIWTIVSTFLLILQITRLG